MKNYTQVYVKNSMEAAKTNCKAFGAEITLEMLEEVAMIECRGTVSLLGERRTYNNAACEVVISTMAYGRGVPR